MKSPLQLPIFKRISRLVDERGVEAYVVGGYVRDYYLRRPCTDIDVVVVGSGIEIAEALGRELKTKVSVFKTFGTAMLHADGYEVEFVRGLGWQNGTEHCWIMFKEADGWYFMDSLYVRSSKLTTKQCKDIGYKWNPHVHPEAK